MKKCTSFIFGTMVGAGMVALYDKYGSCMMNDIKESVKKMKKEASKSIENMM